MTNDQYFPLEANLMNEEAIYRLINEAGIKGFGIYIAMLLELRRKNEYVCTDNTLKVLSRTCRTSLRSVKDVVYNFDLFDIDSFASPDAKISSPYLNRVMKKLDDHRNKFKEAGKKGAEKRWKKNQ